MRQVRKRHVFRKKERRVSGVPVEPPGLPKCSFIRVLKDNTATAICLCGRHVPTHPITMGADTGALSPQTTILFGHRTGFVTGLSSRPCVLPMCNTNIASSNRNCVIVRCTPNNACGDVVGTQSVAYRRMLSLNVGLSDTLFATRHDGVVRRSVGPDGVLVASRNLPILNSFNVSASICSHARAKFSPP